MRIAIVGPGALGGLLTAILHKGIHKSDTLQLLDHNRSRAQHIQNEGLCYEKEGELTRLSIDIFFEPQAMDEVDVLFLCVKSYDVQKSLAYCASLLHPGCLVIFMQNGIGHLQQKKHCNTAAVVFATTTEGATCIGPGHIRHAGIGRTFLGFDLPPGQHHANLLDGIVNRLGRGGMKSATTVSINTRIWSKLFINVGINALTAIHDCCNGELLNIAQAREHMEKAIAEARAVAESEGIDVHSPFEETLHVCEATAHNISSMLQDVRKKRKTEIDAINGAIVAMAHKHNIAAPVNNHLVQQVKAIERTYGV